MVCVASRRVVLRRRKQHRNRSRQRQQRQPQQPQPKLLTFANVVGAYVFFFLGALATSHQAATCDSSAARVAASKCTCCDCYSCCCCCFCSLFGGRANLHFYSVYLNKLNKFEAKQKRLHTHARTHTRHIALNKLSKFINSKRRKQRRQRRRLTLAAAQAQLSASSIRDSVA